MGVMGENFRQQLLEMEEGLRGEKSFSHHAIFGDKKAVLTIVKPMQPKKLQVQVFLCEPGRFQEVKRAELLISYKAKIHAVVKKNSKGFNVAVQAFHGSGKKEISMKFN
ncbi:hypothetical protein A2Y83_05330 [Candidatus Falkowbacteria bacterium RBG_13_39_14]|uniref:Uncharacterized protein n=1 Tax=Candidatus Falkowbacteria bacterium RBG_13_39_14 TaxID=1797985 RepID=A0A1F5S518_9BACT|nr:MAG: hypothetical protein A2Y83_05330 [Candidatus Falkowbacteria bacterium RBG_13_39_14]